MSSEDTWRDLRAAVDSSITIDLVDAAQPPDPSRLDPIYSGTSTAWIGDATKWINGEAPEAGAFMRSGVLIDEKAAFEISTVWACIDVQAKAIAASDWTVTRRISSRRFETLWDDKLTYILNTRPNPDMSAVSFRRAMMFAVLSWGNGYAEIIRDMSNRCVGFYPIHPERVKPVRIYGDIDLTYRVQNQDGGYVDIPAADMIHIKGASIVGLMGANKIGLAAGTMALYMATQQFSQSFFNNGGRPGGVIEVPGTLDDDSFETLKKRWKQRHEGPDNAFKTAILDSNMKYAALPNDATKGQTVESREFNVEEICRWFGVPPHKVQHLKNSSLNNIEHQGKEFVNDCLRPLARELTQEVDYKVLRTRTGLFASKIDLDWQMEGTFKERMEGFREARNTGILNANEIREEIGFDDMGPEGDKYLVQGAMIELKDVGLPYKDNAQPAIAAETTSGPPPKTGKKAPPDPNALLKSWLRQSFARTQAFVKARASDIERNGGTHDNALEVARIKAADYLERQLADLWPFLVESGFGPATVRCGAGVISGDDIDTAIQNILGEKS